jgi:hypothetical protein
MKKACTFIISTFLLTLIACQADAIAAKPPGETPLTTIGQVPCGETRAIYINDTASYTLLVTIFASDNCTGLDSNLYVRLGGSIQTTRDIPDGHARVITFQVPPRGWYITLDCQGDGGGFCSYSILSVEGPVQ